MISISIHVHDKNARAVHAFITQHILSVRVRKGTNKQTNVTHIHGPVAAVNAHTLKASGSVTQLESQLL